jgi:hypothetical protein
VIQPHESSNSTSHTSPSAGGFPVAVTLSAAGQPSSLAAALTTPIHAPSNDAYEVNAPLTPAAEQRQQRRRTHIEAASAGISPPRSRVPSAEPKHNPQLTNDFEEDNGTSTPLAPSLPHPSPEAARHRHRALRISKNRGSAILYALEEALRHPYPFTPDLVEENASMSDIIGGGQPAPAGNGRSGNGRPQAAPGVTGSPIRGPREIMRDREARVRRKAEIAAKEEMERLRAEEEARLIEESTRRAEERRVAAAGAAPPQRGSGEGGQRGSAGTAGQRISDNSQRSERRSGEKVASGERQQDQPLQGVGRGGRAIGGGDEAQPSTRPRPAAASQQPKPAQPEPSRPGPAQTDPAATGPPGGPPQATTSGTTPRSSFPHAFERWETLSAHWEGLTSFWIRRLEENSREISREPISQQLARQVTDLSAAGANLFHAVVELQRLRASSERKFQRWFFETRAEQERAQEIQALTQANLEAERRDRAAAIAEAVALETKRYNADSQLAEMRRELHISKEEARRAWEELGRREQEERDRTASLREGQPTIVGGVQVVPMMQGVPSRHESARDRSQAREAAYTRGEAVQEPEGPVDDSDVAYQQYARAQRAGPADPFVEQQTTSTDRAARSGRVTASEASSYGQEYSQAPAVQPVSSSAFYQQRQGTSLHPTDSTSRSEHTVSYGPSAPSEGAYSEEEYEIDAEGHFVRDERGNKIRYQNPVSDEEAYEYDPAAPSERDLAYLRSHGVPPTSGMDYAVDSPSSRRVAAPTSHPTTTGPADYSGEGYGSGLGWEGVRHHHPTRLSDVLEEDERSRTSASQVSRRD